MIGDGRVVDSGSVIECKPASNSAAFFDLGQNDQVVLATAIHNHESIATYQLLL